MPAPWKFRREAQATAENAFKCNAYHNAARAVQQLEEDLATLVKDGRLGEVRGIGETLQQKITVLVTTGHGEIGLEERAGRPGLSMLKTRLDGIGMTRPHRS